VLVAQLVSWQAVVLGALNVCQVLGLAFIALKAQEAKRAANGAAETLEAIVVAQQRRRQEFR